MNFAITVRKVRAPNVDKCFGEPNMNLPHTRAHSFGHILTKKRGISRTFGLKKRGISRAFKLVLFGTILSQVRDFPKSAGYLALLMAQGTTSRFSQMHELQ
jgi:hypothetical protein